MTTLPQTTGIRLPRPTSITTQPHGGALAGAHAPSATAGGTMTAADIWRVLRANSWLIILLLIVSAFGGYGMNWYLAKYHSRFTASALVAVEPKTHFNPMDPKSDQQNEDYSGLQIVQRTHAAMLTSDSLFSSVLSKPDLQIRQTSWFKQFVYNQPQADGASRDVVDTGAAKLELQDRFTATAIPDSQLIKIEMSCADPQDAVKIIDDIVNTHLDQQRSQSTNKMLDKTSTLNNLKLRLEQHIRELSDRQNNLMMHLNLGQVGNSTGRYTATDMEYQATISKQIEMQAGAMAAQAGYEQMQQQIAAGSDPAMAIDMVERDMQVVSYRDMIARTEVNIRTAIAAGANSRTVRDLEMSRDGFIEQLQKVREEKLIAARASLLSSAQVQAQSAKDALETTSKKIEQLKGQLGDLAIAMSDYLSITDELNTTRTNYKEIKDQLDTIASANADMQVAWAQHPEKPDLPSFPKLPITMSIAIVLGLTLSLGIAFLREMMDTSVRSPRDIARVGQMNLLGMIPHEEDDPQAAGVPAPLIIFQAPTSIIAEQYRQVRTRLQHAASLETTRSIMVTSPAPGDGKTTVACNLAAGLALNGRKILLVDANFRRPELNKIFNVPNDVGFSNAIASVENFEGAIRSTQVPNLDVMTTGQRPANPTELMESQLFTDFVERALEEYDHVIFDTGPMLLVSETAAMAPRVDGVVSVVKAASNSRGLLQRLRDGLRQLKAEHLGVVLNGVRSQGGGYYGRNIKTYYEYQNGQEASAS